MRRAEASGAAAGAGLRRRLLRCHRRLSSADTALEDVVSTFFGLPPGLQEGASFAVACALCKRMLLEHVGDVLAVLNTPALAARFNALPFAAVLELLQSDGLMTNSKKLVLLLLGDWLAGPVGAACKQSQVRKLCRCVRVSRCCRPRSYGWHCLSCPGLRFPCRITACCAPCAPSMASHATARFTRRCNRTACTMPPWICRRRGSPRVEGLHRREMMRRGHPCCPCG